MDATAAALEEAAKIRQQKRERIRKRFRELTAEGIGRTEVMSRLRISSGYYYLLRKELGKEKHNGI